MNNEIIDVLKYKAASTASSVVLGSLLLISNGTFQPQIINTISGNPTAKTITAPIVGTQSLHKNDLVEANDEEVMALFLEIEPKYKITNQRLADL